MAGQNAPKSNALDCGFKRKLGPLTLNPEGMIAMRGQKHPITSVGIRNLTQKVLDIAKADMQFAECEVFTDPNQKIDGRNCTMVMVTHPERRQQFQGHIARLFFDNEHRVPIYYDAYLWPETEGAPPPLEESYMYRNLQLNNGFGARDFDAKNPEIFQP